MTGDTIVRIIVFLVMFPVHFVVIMASAARVIRRVTAGMAFGAFTIRPFMIDGEGVVE